MSVYSTFTSLCTYFYIYTVFQNIRFIIFSSFLTQMLTDFNNSFTATFLDKLQKNL